MFGLNLATLPQRIGVAVIALSMAFAAGYTLRWHRDSLVEAKKETIVKTVTVVQESIVKVTDDAAVSRLNAQLATSKQHADSLQNQIKELSNAKPADPVCRLPDGLRDQLNYQLATDQPEPVGAVRP